MMKMKSNPLRPLLYPLGLCLSLAAAPAGAAGELLARKDRCEHRNGDRRADRGALDARGQARFERLDGNRDGVIRIDELPGRYRNRMERLGERLDALRGEGLDAAAFRRLRAETRKRFRAAGNHGHDAFEPGKTRAMKEGKRCRKGHGKRLRTGLMPHPEKRITGPRYSPRRS